MNLLNWTNVERFFALLKFVMDKYHFSINCVWNMDDTRITTVHTSNRVIRRGGMKQIGRITSAKQKTLVNLAVSTIDHSLSLFITSLYFLHGESQGCTSEANQIV